MTIERARGDARLLGETVDADPVKAKATELWSLYGNVKAGRYNALAVTALEQSVMWIVKELTS